MIGKAAYGSGGASAAAEREAPLTATAELQVCPMPCDDDCDVTCHEGHQVLWKRTHTLDSCQRPEGPEWAEWVPEGERHA